MLECESRAASDKGRAAHVGYPANNDHNFVHIFTTEKGGKLQRIPTVLSYPRIVVFQSKIGLTHPINLVFCLRVVYACEIKRSTPDGFRRVFQRRLYRFILARCSGALAIIIHGMNRIQLHVLDRMLQSILQYSIVSVAEDLPNDDSSINRSALHTVQGESPALPVLPDDHSTLNAMKEKMPIVTYNLLTHGVHMHHLYGSSVYYISRTTSQNARNFRRYMS